MRVQKLLTSSSGFGMIPAFSYRRTSKLIGRERHGRVLDLRYSTMMFWVIALVAAVFAFGEIAVPAAGLARILGLTAAALGVISLIHDVRMVRRPI